MKQSEPNQLPASPEEDGLTLNLSTRMLLAGAGAIALLDQLAKVLADSALEYGVKAPVFPGFDLLLAYNRGAAFSFLNDASGWQRWILSGISLGVSVFLLVWLVRLPRQQKLLRVALAIILGGALGNLYDRLVFGYVIDFVSVYFQDWRFATFNIADAAISIGAMLLALDLFTNQSESSS